MQVIYYGGHIAAAAAGRVKAGRSGQIIDHSGPTAMTYLNAEHVHKPRDTMLIWALDHKVSCSLTWPTYLRLDGHCSSDWSHLQACMHTGWYLALLTGESSA